MSLVPLAPFLLLNSYFLISRFLGYFENLDLLGDAAE